MNIIVYYKIYLENFVALVDSSNESMIWIKIKKGVARPEKVARYLVYMTAP